jgi:cytochrome b subunit of formate dehydrogenase/predicted regulator of Ras-like GTPase activity (Roadblock/LC7/MglB family)
MNQINVLNDATVTSQSDDANGILEQVGNQISNLEVIALIAKNGHVLARYPLQSEDDKFVTRMGSALGNFQEQLHTQPERRSVRRLIMEDDYGYVVTLDVGGNNSLLFLTDANTKLGSILVDIDSTIEPYKKTLSSMGQQRHAVHLSDAQNSLSKQNTPSPTTTHLPSPRTDAFTVIAHWLLVAGVVVSLLTGLRIAADDDSSLINGIAGTLEPILPQGSVIEGHILSSWLLLFVIFAYPIFIWRSKVAERLKVDKFGWQRIKKSWRAGKLWSDEPSWFAINRLLFYVGFVATFLMAVTGLKMYFSSHSSFDHPQIAMVHNLTAAVFLIYIFLHVLAAVKTGVLLKIFRPRLAYISASIIAVLAASSLLSAAYLMDRNTFEELAIIPVSTPPTLDGQANDSAWQNAPAVTIDTARGANFPGGEVSVTAKAVHDGERFYFLFRWPDPQRSQKHLPLVKVEGGWQVMQSEFDVNDEDDFYEDKFSVLLSHSPSIGSGTVHLGKNLIPGPHRPTNRGLHYTVDGSYVDMWHWKSVRTGGMQPGLMDDNHFGPPTRPEPGKRYTAGYDKDPHKGGGYTLNWDKIDNTKSLNETFVAPKFLPIDPALLNGMGEVNLDPDMGDKGVWHLNDEETMPYRPELDHYPIGTVIPGVVISGPFTGDRADVRAEGNWQDGYWTLEIARAFDTQSQFDIPLSRDGNGPDVFLWVAAFNHTQTRHSQHLRPVRLTVEVE